MMCRRPVVLTFLLPFILRAGVGLAAERPTATWLGQVESHSGPTVAISWKGGRPAHLEVFEDLDGDGGRGPGERILATAAVSNGIEVVLLEGAQAGVPLAARWWSGGERGSFRIEAVASEGACAWQGGQVTGELDGGVLAMTVFDDGTGPALYVGGSFLGAGEERVNGIARWDGRRWSALAGPAGAGVDGQVRALAVWDDGRGPALYAGGWFSSAGGVPASHVARWDGRRWSALAGPAGQGVSDAEDPKFAQVEALVVWNDGDGSALYVGGRFDTAGAAVASNLARWDGRRWLAVAGVAGQGTDGPVTALAVWDDGRGEALYVGGGFATAGVARVSGIARWDGRVWSPLAGPKGEGVSGGVSALVVWNDGSGEALYAGGLFDFAGGMWARGVARWDGDDWSVLKGPRDVGANGVLALAVWNDGAGEALYAGGRFLQAGGLHVNRIARWDGREWSAMSGLSHYASTEVHALASWDDGGGEILYVGGYFSEDAELSAANLATWDGAAWASLDAPHGGGIEGFVHALEVWDDGGGEALYVGGEFDAAWGAPASGIARWDGTTWTPLAGPSEEGIRAGPYRGSVYALRVWNDGGGEALYVGGSFTVAGGVGANGIARWDGVGWSALPGPAGEGVQDGWVRALAAWDGGGGEALYVGGTFTGAGGIAASHIARWDGDTWSALAGPAGEGVSSWVLSLATWGARGLYVGGKFASAGGVPAQRVARWDGSRWSALEGPAGEGLEMLPERRRRGDCTPLVGPEHVFYSAANDLVRWNDGRGEALFVAGRFNTAGGVPASCIARWDGSRWSPLRGPAGEGVDETVDALGVWDDGSGEALYVGGDFGAAGGLVASHVARWDGGSWSALAGPLDEGLSGSSTRVYALSTWDDGSGDALFFGGIFDLAGGLPSHRIAKWQCGYVSSPALPGFVVRALIRDPKGAEIEAALEPACIPETLCFSGAVPGRAEVFVRVVGPKPNGYLWPTIVKFTTSEVEVWIRQLATGAVRHYRLPGASPGNDVLPGLFDPTGFRP